jgi:hypothetical protein
MYKRVIFLAYCFHIATVLALPAQAYQAGSIQSEGQGITLLRIVVLDVSGSMSEADTKKGSSRLNTARKEILESLQQLPVSSKTPVILIPFNESVRDDLERIYTDARSLTDAIARLKPDGQTNIAAGLSRSIERASQLGLCNNILLYLYSDGEHNVGSKSLVRKQEKNLDTLFGQRASKGLSQTVIVKRWGGVIGQLVANLQKSPHVKVVDAGELELATVTLVPSVTIKDVKWQNVASGLASIQMDVTVSNRRAEITLPAQTSITISCPFPGSRWLSPPTITVTKPTQMQTFSLLVRLDPRKFDLAKNYTLPLHFHGPSQVRTCKGLFILVINPKQVSCVLPTGQLRPIVTMSAKLYKQGKPCWKDLDKRIAVWPMCLRLEITTTPPFAWPEQVKWNAYGLKGVKVATDGPIVLQGRPKQVNVKLTKHVSVDELIQGKPIKAQIELRAITKPKTLHLSSVRIVLTIQIELPAIQNTRINQQVSFVGTPQWIDLTAGLVTVPVKLDIAFDGMLAPGTVLGLVPCKDVVKVDGVPIRIHSGQQTVQITLTGKVNSAASLVKWSLELKPPPPSYGIRYIEPPPVTVSFIAPDAVQVILSKGGEILTSYDCRGNKPQQAILGYGRLELVGFPVQDSAVGNLRVKGSLQDSLGGNGFSMAKPGQWVSWSMRPNDPATSVRWWHDTVVKGSLLVLPENAAPGAMLGSVVGLSVTYEAFYKKVAFYLAVGLVVVLVGTILFWLARMGLGVYAPEGKWCTG